MAIQLPALPFEPSDLEPYISERTLSFHHGKHHAHYVKTLNELIDETDYEKMSLEEIVVESAGQEGKEHKIFNNAGQAWNHNFFWNCLAKSSGRPSNDFVKLIEKDFGTFDHFKEQFIQKSIDLFGSGWLWLVKDHDERLSLIPLSNAGNPLPTGESPLLVCDVWEHAYYLDYQNARKKFVENFFNVINWRFVEKCYEKPQTDTDFVFRSTRMGPGYLEEQNPT